MPTPRPNLIAVVHTDDGDICLDDLFEEDQLSIDIIEFYDNKTAGVDLTPDQAQELIAHILTWLKKYN